MRSAVLGSLVLAGTCLLAAGVGDDGQEIRQGLCLGVARLCKDGTYTAQGLGAVLRLRLATDVVSDPNPETEVMFEAEVEGLLSHLRALDLESDPDVDTVSVLVLVNESVAGYAHAAVPRGAGGEAMRISVPVPLSALPPGEHGVQAMLGDASASPLGLLTPPCCLASALGALKALAFSEHDVRLRITNPEHLSRATYSSSSPLAVGVRVTGFPPAPLPGGVRYRVLLSINGIYAAAFEVPRGVALADASRHVSILVPGLVAGAHDLQVQIVRESPSPEGSPPNACGGGGC